MPSTDNVSRVELSASGSVVDIVSIPCHFYATKYDLLDQLFVPLLSAAQEANDLLGLRVGDDKTAFRAASYVAGELLRDKSFSPARSLASIAAHSYLIDLPANNFQAETNVSSGGGGSSSIFRVRVRGAIRGDKFMVVDPSTNNTLFTFTRFEASNPNFFVRDFPFLAQEARRDPTLVSGGQPSLVHGVIDLMLGVLVRGKTIAVRVQKLADSSSVEIKLATTNQTIMCLPYASLGNIAKLVEIISQHMSTDEAAFNSVP